MYHYDPAIALEELQEDAVLPNPVHIRDMIVRARLDPDQALELNRKFQTLSAGFRRRAGDRQIDPAAVGQAGVSGNHGSAQRLWDSCLNQSRGARIDRILL